RIEDDEIESRRPASQQPRPAVEEVVELVDDPGAFRLAHDRRITGDQRAHQHAMRRQGARQRPGHVGQPTRLDQRVGFRRDRKNIYHLLARYLSIIACVTSVTPSSVRRNQRRSNSASSPTTNPSGMLTPRSMTTLWRRAPRPTLQ